jgi:hypothetical protein
MILSVIVLVAIVLVELIVDKVVAEELSAALEAVEAAKIDEKLVSTDCGDTDRLGVTSRLRVLSDKGILN